MILGILLFVSKLPAQDRLGVVDPQNCKDTVLALLNRNRVLDRTDVGYEDLKTARIETISVSGGIALFQIAGSFGSFETETGLAAKIHLEDLKLRAFRKINQEDEISESVRRQAVVDVLKIIGWQRSVSFAGSIRHRHGENAYYSVFVAPITGDRPLSPDYQIQADIDASAGQLIRIYLPRFPDLEFANDEVLDNDILKKKTWEAYLKHIPYDDGVVSESRLVLEPPRYQKPHDLDEEYIRL